MKSCNAEMNIRPHTFLATRLSRQLLVDKFVTIKTALKVSNAFRSAFSY